jgi:hypothetical protein
MRRTLAIALAVGLLFMGGCGRARPHSTAPPAPPAVSTTAPAAPAAANDSGVNAGNAGNAGKSDGSDVDNLLDQVGQQLSNDAQPAEDED